MSSPIVRRLLAPVLLAGSLSGTAFVVVADQPAAAAATIAQASHCEGQVPRLDLTVANSDPAPITVDLLLDGVVVETDQVVPASGEAHLSVTYAPDISSISVVDAGSDAELASAPVTAVDPGCALPDDSSSDITFSSTSPCEEEEVHPRLYVTNDGPIDAVVDILIDGQLHFDDVTVTAGVGFNEAIDWDDAPMVQVRDALTDQVLAEGQLADATCPGPGDAPAARPVAVVPTFTG